MKTKPLVMFTMHDEKARKVIIFYCKDGANRNVFHYNLKNSSSSLSASAFTRFAKKRVARPGEGK